MILDFEDYKKEVIDFFEANNVWVLATSFNDHVTARSMSTINFDLNLYFQTDSQMEKYKQMLENPQVALCFKNYQVEGIASVKGKVSENLLFLDKYKIIHPSSFEKYSDIKTEVVIEIKPLKIKIWKYIDQKPFLDFIDLENCTAERKRCLWET
jgi:general stress protein 26